MNSVSPLKPAMRLSPLRTRRIHFMTILMREPEAREPVEKIHTCTPGTDREKAAMYMDRAHDFPHLRGVRHRTFGSMMSTPNSRITRTEFAPQSLPKIFGRHARMKALWNFLWSNDRCSPNESR